MAKAPKAAHRLHQLIESLRHFQRDNQQSHSEREDAIAQALDARDFMAAPAKLLVVAYVFVDQFFTDHFLSIGGSMSND
ncbi:MAG: hypothetical protein QOG23_438 [Blastocatellia bacterium]|nr:hypothetical protein [Blastocatellia bacterium]